MSNIVKNKNKLDFVKFYCFLCLLSCCFSLVVIIYVSSVFFPTKLVMCFSVFKSKKRDQILPHHFCYSFGHRVKYSIPLVTGWISWLINHPHDQPLAKTAGLESPASPTTTRVCVCWLELSTEMCLAIYYLKSIVRIPLSFGKVLNLL